MSCPDWPALAACRDQDSEGDHRWQRALEHLDGCPSCREAAYAAEPTLVFRRLPAIETTDDDTRAMQQAVAAMRRAQPLVEPEARGRRSRRGRGRPAVWLRRAAAVIVVPLAAVLLFQATDLSDVGSTPDAVVTSPDLYFDVQVLRADLEVIAQADVTSREGESVTSALGDGFEVSFKAGQVDDDGRLRLEGFRIAPRAPVAAAKGRQIEADPLLEPGRRREAEPIFYATLNLWLGQPLTLIVAQEESLVVAVTCRRNRVTAVP